MAAAMSAAGASSDRRAGDSARSASHHAGGRGHADPRVRGGVQRARGDGAERAEGERGGGERADGDDRVTTRPKRYPAAAEVAIPRRRAMLSCPMGETPNQRSGSSGMAIPSRESE